MKSISILIVDDGSEDVLADFTVEVPSDDALSVVADRIRRMITDTYPEIRESDDDHPG
jgi:hypothetical protein